MFGDLSGQVATSVLALVILVLSGIAVRIWKASEHPNSEIGQEHAAIIGEIKQTQQHVKSAERSIKRDIAERDARLHQRLDGWRNGRS